MTSGKPIDIAPDELTAVSPLPAKPSLAHRPWALALVLVIATFIAYQPVWRAGFIWDDDTHLTANSAITAPHGLQSIWHSLAVARYYPLTLTNYWVQRHLWGFHPLPYHLVNVLFHAANAVAIFFLLRYLRLRAAWLVAMIWALHPVNVQSVAWISELKNTQSALFFFLSVLFYLQYDDHHHARNRWYSPYLAGVCYLCAFISAAAAILSDASTAVLPAAMLLAVWWQRGRWERADIIRIFPFVAMSWFVAGLAALAQYSHAARTGAAPLHLSTADRLIVAGKAVWFYVAKDLWPFHLAFVYPRWTLRSSSLWSWIPITALLALAIALWRCRNRLWARATLFAGAYFVTTLAPVLGLFSLYYFQYSFVTDRFQYLASVAIILLACAAAAALWNRFGPARPAAAPVIVTLLLVSLGALTWSHARLYQSSESLWRDTITKNPGSWLAHNALGYALMNDGLTNAAVSQYQQALLLNPRYTEAHCNLGYVFLQNGNFTAAIAQYQDALRLIPDLYQVHYNLAVALEQTGRLEDAVDHYEQALQIKPDYAEAHGNLATIFLQEGRIADAIDHYQHALLFKPAVPQLHFNLANALQQAGRTAAAIDQYQQALLLNPDYIEAQIGLGSAFLRAGRIPDAIAQYQHALRIKPDAIEAHRDLGDIFLQQGRTADAITHFRQILRIKPDDAMAHYSLGLALEQQGRWEEAFTHFEQALWINPDFPEARFALALLQMHQY